MLVKHSFGLVKMTAELPSYSLLEGEAGKLNILCAVIAFKWCGIFMCMLL